MTDINAVIEELELRLRLNDNERDRARKLSSHGDMKAELFYEYHSGKRDGIRMALTLLKDTK